MCMINFINYDFVIAGGVGVITTILSGIFGALFAVLTARRCAKIGEKPLCIHCRLMPDLSFHYMVIIQLDTIPLISSVR